MQIALLVPAIAGTRWDSAELCWDSKILGLFHCPNLYFRCPPSLLGCERPFLAVLPCNSPFLAVHGGGLSARVPESVGTLFLSVNLTVPTSG